MSLKKMKQDDTTDAIPDDSSHPAYQHTPDDVEPSSLGDSGVVDDIDIVTQHVSLHSEDAYRMNHRRRGKLVIICNTEFNADLKLNIRKGTENDIAAIKKVFRDILHFEVIEHKQQKRHEMLRAISTAANDRDNKECDCFAVFILTHGSDSDKVYGTDADILVSKLMEPLKENDSLVGKPKMLFVQACRGKKLDHGQKMACDPASQADNGSGTNQVTIPVEADFLYVYSTADGYVSFQNPNSGSWFVQALCKELEKNWQKLEMLQMLTRVCRALAYEFSSYTPSNPETHHLKQISSVTTTLTKAIRFEQP